MRRALVALILVFGLSAAAAGQSSSLFRQAQAERTAQEAATTKPSDNGSLPASAGAAPTAAASSNTELAKASLTALKLPEPKVLKVNDFVGVVVRYQLRHESRSKVEQDSNWDVKSKLDAWFRIHDQKLQQQNFGGGTPEVNFSNQNELQNEGKADRKDVFETRVMAKVIDVKPNGTLILVAWSRMEIDNEAQYLRMTGECNRTDITADGNITSDKIFGLDVRTMNEGAVRDAVKRGWFKELFDTAKPF